MICRKKYPGMDILMTLEETYLPVFITWIYVFQYVQSETLGRIPQNSLK